MDDMAQVISFCIDQNMPTVPLSSEGRDYFMWCPDADFDRAVMGLDMRGLVELIHVLQDAMAVEQQTFESLSQQLEQIQDPLLQQRMSAALCTSQTRLARLCARNMRCFTLQTLKSDEKEGLEESSAPLSYSRSEILSEEGTVLEENKRMPPTASSAPKANGHNTFKNSLTFFQKAVNLMSGNNQKEVVTCDKKSHSKKSVRKSQDNASKTYLSNTQNNVSIKNRKESRKTFKVPNGIPHEENDSETYEQVLYINGRPQFQSESRKRSHSYDPLLDSSRDSPPERKSIAVNTDSETVMDGNGSNGRRSRSWTRVQIGSADCSVAEIVHDEAPNHSVAYKDPSHSQSLSDVATCITLPRRKPVLNFSSLTDPAEGFSVNDKCDITCNSSRFGDNFNGDNLNKSKSTLCRTQSFKEGLDYNSDLQRPPTLTRAQSLYDGLDEDDSKLTTYKTKLRRAPSVEEILESVKNLRTKNNMVQSHTDYVSRTNEEYHERQPSSSKSKKHSKRSKDSSRVTSPTDGKANTSNSSERKSSRHENRSTSHTSDHKRSKSHSKRKENIQTPENYYDTVRTREDQYENLPLNKVEVIYDKPKDPKPVENSARSIINSPNYGSERNDTVYENLNDNNAVYMNVSEFSKTSNVSSNKQNTIYANISVNNYNNDLTYDVPKSNDHIYDTPKKHPKVLRPKLSKFNVENNYDTPYNNRLVNPHLNPVSSIDKRQQEKKIEDIFATCEVDSLPEDYEEKCLSIRVPDFLPEDGANESLKQDVLYPDYIDEGLGESDARSYYADDQGLEVILEEPEDDYSSTHSSAEDLRRHDLRFRTKGERRSLGSLEESEGIGSGEGEEEGDTHSSGASEGVGDEDCSSSGVHSEDTSFPGPQCHKIKSKSRRDFSCEEGANDKQEEERVQKDRCLEIYPETIRQRQRNMAPSPSKVDIKNWEIRPTTPVDDKKYLPSVKALRSQFENGSGPSTNLVRSSNSSSTNSLVMSSLENSSGFGSLGSSRNNVDISPIPPAKETEEEHIEPIFNQFKSIDENLKEIMARPPSTQGWDPGNLLKRLYYLPEAPKITNQKVSYVNMEGYLDKLPSGRKKATFWNAWKRRYFQAKDGVLYYYQNNQTDKPSMKLPLMGGKIEIMDCNMITVDDGGKEEVTTGMLGIDDGKGHYVVVRGSSREETERWKSALETHTVDDFSTHFVQPWPIPTNPSLLRDTLIVDIGSCSVRAGILASQPTLPQLFFPSVLAVQRETKKWMWGVEALSPEVRSNSTLSFPIKPSHKISKFSVDLVALSSLLQKTFSDLRIDPKSYNIQLSLPRILNPNTQAELMKILFEKFHFRSVNMTHQSILALYAYNASSGIVVDIGERMDVIPVIDGYIVEGGVSRVPYGGSRILDHIRQFLYQKNVSLLNEVDSLIIRKVLESICYCAQHYNTEKQRCTLNPPKFEKSCNMSDYLPDSPQFNSLRKIPLDFGRFQTTEGLFNPDAWGLDHPGLHKLVHKGIQECSMDARKEISRSIFLAGGVTMLPGMAERLSIELDNLTPPAIRPKVHASPYRYHAAYLGACVLAESNAFQESKITAEEWIKQGTSALRKWFS